MSYVVFDLETTGLSPARDAIIQIAGVRLRDGEVVTAESFATFVDPGGPIPPFIQGFTGITDAQVRGAPPAAEALRQFSQFVGDSVLIAHNGHRFDMAFVRAACEREALPTRAIEYLDSLALSWAVWGRAGRHGLDTVMWRLGIGTGDQRRHDARGDVHLLAQAVLAMCGRLAWDGHRIPLPPRAGVLPAEARAVANDACGLQGQRAEVPPPVRA